MDITSTLTSHSICEELTENFEVFSMKYKVVVYYDNMQDSVHVFNSKDEAINELHRLRGVKYRNSRMYTVELVECGG